MPARSTEAHHFRRVVVQREILRSRGVDHVEALGLGPAYSLLRNRLDELGLERRKADIYRTSPLFTGPRDHTTLTGRCGSCEFAPVCGGSRSRAFALTGDPHAEDPWCSYRPGTFPHPDDLAAADPRPAPLQQ